MFITSLFRFTKNLWEIPLSSFGSCECGKPVGWQRSSRLAAPVSRQPERSQQHGSLNEPWIPEGAVTIYWPCANIQEMTQTSVLLWPNKSQQVNCKLFLRDQLQINGFHHLYHSGVTLFLLARGGFMSTQKRQDNGTQFRMRGFVFVYAPHTTTYIYHSQLSGAS